MKEIELLLKKIKYLQDRIPDFETEEARSQKEYLKSEIDSLTTDILKLEIQEHYREIEK